MDVAFGDRCQIVFGDIRKLFEDSGANVPYGDAKSRVGPLSLDISERGTNLFGGVRRHGEWGGLSSWWRINYLRSGWKGR